MRSIEDRLGRFIHQLTNSSKLLIALLGILQFAYPITAQGTQFDWKPVEQAIGKGGTLQPEGVFKIGLPRKDLVVTVKGVTINPVLALGSWVAFKKMVLTAAEVNSVIHALRENNIAVTAIHSHMFEESPRLFFLHFWANDDALKLARGLRAALDKTNSVK